MIHCCLYCDFANVPLKWKAMAWYMRIKHGRLLVVTLLWVFMAGVAGAVPLAEISHTWGTAGELTQNGYMTQNLVASTWASPIPQTHTPTTLHPSTWVRGTTYTLYGARPAPMFRPWRLTTIRTIPPARLNTTSATQGLLISDIRSTLPLKRLPR